jgi:23S rRNA (guanosine2251-2'-O)-methyltransferase
MPGNSRRQGAVRKPGSKKGAVVGSGGQRRQQLEGKGPTPKATERPGHKAHRQTKAAAGRTPSSAGPGQNRSGQNRSAGRRSAGSSEMVAGRNPVVEAMRAGVPVKALYVGHGIESDDRVREAIRLAGDLGIPLLEGSKTDLDRLTNNAVHQGLVLQVPPYAYAHPSDLIERAHDAGRAPLIVALDGVTDPRNLGAVVRSVAAFGGHGVVVPERRSAGMTAGAWKTSAGAAVRVPVAKAANLTRALEDYRKAGLFVVGLDAGGDITLPEVDLVTGPLVLVIGSEGKGLTRLVRETCDHVASIPMAAGTESLNAGVAAGVALYEVARRRGF